MMADLMDQADATATPSRTRRIVVGCAKLTVSLGLLWLLFSRTDVNSIWLHVRHASAGWLLAGLLLYIGSVGIAAWRWGLLCDAQGITVGTRALFTSYLVATFFNNFLPSNIGGDVIRIRDTAETRAARRRWQRPSSCSTAASASWALVLVAAIGARWRPAARARRCRCCRPGCGRGSCSRRVVGAPAVIAPAGVGRLLQPLTVFHPEWVGDRITRSPGPWSGSASVRPRCSAPSGRARSCRRCWCSSTRPSRASLNIPITTWHLAVIVPVSFVMQMLPVSVNGFGVREATFSFYFSRIGLPISPRWRSRSARGADHALLAHRRRLLRDAPASAPREGLTLDAQRSTLNTQR